MWFVDLVSPTCITLFLWPLQCLELTPHGWCLLAAVWKAHCMAWVCGTSIEKQWGSQRSGATSTVVTCPLFSISDRTHQCCHGADKDVCESSLTPSSVTGRQAVAVTRGKNEPVSDKVTPTTHVIRATSCLFGKLVQLSRCLGCL